MNDDEKTWLDEVQNVTPLSARAREKIIKPLIKKNKTIIAPAIKKTIAIQPAPPVPPPLTKSVVQQPLANVYNQSKIFDKNILRKIKTGAKKIEAQIDLHQCTQDEARLQIKNFLQLAIKKNQRLLLIITGRGKNDTGILKRQVPHWLENSSFANLVSKYAVADKRHGGPGAIYVQPKKNRT